MHVVSGKLRKAPFIKDNCGQDGQSKMYAIELSEMTQDYKTQEKSYTNYRAVLFAKTQAAKQFYDNATAQDSFVVLTCEKLKVDSREHEGKTYITSGCHNKGTRLLIPANGKSKSVAISKVQVVCHAGAWIQII